MTMKWSNLIRAGEIEVKWVEATAERRKMTMKWSNLIRNVHTARGKVNMQVARMRVKVHIEWTEELDARGKRLQVEVKELKTELEEIGRLNLEHEKENELLRKALARFETFSTQRSYEEL